jgi:hypothetical protein
VAGVFHAGPGFSRFFGGACLQEFDRDIVRRSDKSHVAIARRPVDDNTIVLQVLAGGIDVIDRVREVAKVAAVRGQFVVAIPVVGQFDRSVFLTGRGQEDEAEAAGLAVLALGLFQAEEFVERHGFFQILHADHCVQIFEWHCGTFQFGPIVLQLFST